MRLNVDDLSSFQDSEFENLQMIIAKEKRRRTKASRVKWKLEKQANAICYTLVLKNGADTDLTEDLPTGRQDQTAQQTPQQKTPQQQPNQEHEIQEQKSTSRWNLGALGR
jgi:hypothetical protein